MGEVTNQTVKGHGHQVGDVFAFYGGNWAKELDTPIVVRLSKPGTKYVMTDAYTGETVMELGSTAKFLSDGVTDNDGCWERVEERTLDNGDKVWTGSCVHGWMTGLHASKDDATAVVRAHGKISRPLYVAPIAPVEPTALEVEEAVALVDQNRRVFCQEVTSFGMRAEAFDRAVALGVLDVAGEGPMVCWVRAAHVGDTVYRERDDHQGTVTAQVEIGMGVPTFKIDFPRPGEYSILTVDEMVSMGYEVIPAAEVTEGERMASVGTVAKVPALSRPVSALLNRRKRKATRRNRARMGGGF